MIVTPDTSEFKPFFFLSTDVAPSFQLRVIASDDPFHLGVLSSRIHRTWAFAAGAKMGVGNDPRYLNTLCFDPFPFPEATDGQREEIGRLGEAIDQHRWDAVARDPRLAAGRLYSIIKRVQFGFTLEDDERADYELGACATLADLHAGLDHAVANAYGWSPDLQRDALLGQLVVTAYD